MNKEGGPCQMPRTDPKQNYTLALTSCKGCILPMAGRKYWQSSNSKNVFRNAEFFFTLCEFIDIEP